MNQPDNSRYPLILSVERIALVGRYAGLLILPPLFLTGRVDGNPGIVAFISSIVILHNVYVHWVLLTGRYRLFLTGFNFALYFIETTLFCSLTGADNSDAYVLYFLLLIGFSAYHRQFRLTIIVTLLCCFGYATVLLVEWYQANLTQSEANLAARFIFMGVCGWLVASMSVQLRRGETGIQEQAEALAASEATLRTILDSAAESILVYDEREFITEANDRAREFLGLPREQLLGRRIRSFMFDDGTLPNKFASLRARGEFRGELILVNADGEERNVDFRVRSYTREGQRFYVAVANDITEQKNLQEATRLANANLERLNRELRSVDQLKTAFLATISQKLRSPLSAVLGFLEMMIEEELGEINPEQRNALQTSRRATLRVFRIIDEALELRYRESGAGSAQSDSSNGSARASRKEPAHDSGSPPAGK